MSTDQRSESRRDESIDARLASLRVAQERLDSLITEPAEGARAPGLRRGLTACAIALLGFVGTAAVLRSTCEALAPGSAYGGGSVEGHKAHEFATNPEAFDVVFLGTSRVYRQFDATSFDAHMAELGTPVRSYNFGLSGLRHPESRQMARWLLKHRPPGLRWLFVEVTGEITHDARGLLHEGNAYSHRFIQWHTPSITALVLRGVLASDLAFATVVDAVWTHLAHLGLRVGNVGLAMRTSRSLYGAIDAEEAMLPDPRGHLTLDRESAATPERTFRRPRFLREPAWVGEQLEVLRGHPADAQPDPTLAESLRQLADEIRAAGIEPVFVKMPPHWHRGAEMYREDARHGLPNLLDLAAPERYPEFYELDHMFNRGHLNDVGAALFTRALAERFARHLEETEGRPPR